jgi:hypothetical protein
MDARNENPRRRRGQGTAVFSDSRDPITEAILHDALRAARAEAALWPKPRRRS